MAEAVDDGVCVYVKQALLDQLEGDKRALKWKLSSATKDAETRAAQLEESAAKVKDLMTIVEMNRTVADKAVLRSYTKETILQQLHQERMQLVTRVETQQRRAIDALRRRRVSHQLREAFRHWISVVKRVQSERHAIQRMLQSQRRRRLRHAWQQWWKRIKHFKSPIVHPLPSAESWTIRHHRPPSAKRSVHFEFSPASSFASDSSSTTSSSPWRSNAPSTSLSFASWKAQWLARHRKHKTAMHFARLTLAKRVLAAWKQLVRRRNWRVAMAVSVLEHKRSRCFQQWVSWTTRRRRLKTLLTRLTRRSVQRLQLSAFVRLRVNGLHKCLIEWGDILRDARNAVDEERRLNKIQHDREMVLLHDHATRMAEYRRREVDGRVKTMVLRRRRLQVRCCLAQWRQRVAGRRLQMRVAAQHASRRGPRRILRLVLRAWAHLSKRRREVAVFHWHHTQRSNRQLLYRSFHALRRLTQQLSARKKALFRLLYRCQSTKLRRSLWRWRTAVALAGAHDHTQMHANALSLQLEIHDSAWQAEAQRLRRVVAKYQWQCALALGDARRFITKRSVLTAWRGRSLLCKRRRTIIKRLLCRKRHRAVGLALDRWRLISERWSRILTVLEAMRGRKMVALQRRVLVAWRVSMHHQRAKQTQQRLQTVVLELWRKRSDHRHARNTALRLLVRCRAKHAWLKPAFATWRQANRVASAIERRRREYHIELVQRLFRRWCRWTSRILKRRERQLAMVATRSMLLENKARVSWVWAAWKAATERSRLVGGHCAMSMSRMQRRKTRERALRLVWAAWRSFSRLQCERRWRLRAIASKYRMSLAALGWRRWRQLVETENAVSQGSRLQQRKMVDVLRHHQRMQLLRRTLAQWRQRSGQCKQQRVLQLRWATSRRRATLASCFTHWRLEFLQWKRMQRWLLRAILTRKWKAVLQRAWSQWQRFAMAMLHDERHSTVTNRHTETRARVLAMLRRVWTTRGLRDRFSDWKAYTVHGQRQKKVLARLLSRSQRGAISEAWGVWRTRVRVCATVERFVAVVERWRLRAAWRAFISRLNAIALQRQAATRLVFVLGKAVVRRAWSDWKQWHQRGVVQVAIAAHSTVASTLEVFLSSISTKHFTKTLLLKAFNGWRRHALRQHALRARVVSLLTKQDTSSVRRCFLAWTTHADTCVRGKNALQRVLLRHRLQCQRDGIFRWRAFAIQAAYSQTIAQTQRQLEQHREALARHIALVLFKSSTRPTLAAVVRGWKEVVESRHRLVERIDEGMRLRRLKAVWSGWLKEMRRHKLLAKTMAKLVTRKQRTMVAVAWEIWRSYCDRVNTVETVVGRLVVSYEKRLLRSAWRALHLHQELVRRRQSMMIVVSAQQQFDRQKELLRLRTIASLMQRREKSRATECIAKWKSYTTPRRQRHVLHTTVTRRYERRSLRSHLRSWRALVLCIRSQRLRIERWQTTVCKERRLRSSFVSWEEFVTRRHHACDLLCSILIQRARATLSLAWRVWWSAALATAREQEAQEARRWRRASTVHQTQAASLANKTELLLLETVALKRAMEDQRWRCMEVFARRLLTVMEKNQTRAVCTAWRRWMRVVQCFQTLDWLCNRLRHSIQRRGFQTWREATTRERLLLLESTALDRVGRILYASSVRRRRKLVLSVWSTFVSYRRKSRIVQMGARKTYQRLLIRWVFSSWTNATRVARVQWIAADMVVNRRSRIRVGECFHRWIRWKQSRVAQRAALLSLSRILKTREQRSLTNAWCQWRLRVADTAAAIAHSELMLRHCAEDSIKDKYPDITLLTRTMRAWREHTRLHTHYMVALASQFQVHRIKTHLRRTWQHWTVAVLKGKSERLTDHRPVLCVRLPISKSSRSCKVQIPSTVLCSYADYTRHRFQWRQQLTRRCTLRRLRRVFALTIFARYLDRARIQLLHRAVWRWFAHIQRISLALGMIDYRALPWKRENVDYASSMLLLVLEEMDLSKQTARTELLQRAWSTVDAIVVAHRRRSLMRAFARWRWQNSSKHTRYTRECGVARARAFALQLTRVHTRWAFRAWKNLYILLALRDAELNNALLVSRLEQVVAQREHIEADGLAM